MMVMDEYGDSGARSVWTISQIAEHLGIARHRVEYAIDALGIEPIEKIGNTRIYSSEVVDAVVGQMVVITRMSEIGGEQ